MGSSRQETTGGSDAEVVAAGAVVLRDTGRGSELLVVHRPRYRDWSLPKGKLARHELAPVAAVREVLEETGVTVRLGATLGSTRYPIAKRTKVVHWWVGHVVSEAHRAPDSEVDQVAWIPVEDAIERLTYPDEAQIVRRARRTPDQGLLLVVRHGKAQSRRHFQDEHPGAHDAERPLSSRGERQARGLVALLDAYGVTELVASSSRRCSDTLAPYRRAAGLPLRRVDLLSEEGGRVSPRQVRAYLGRLRAHAAAYTDQPMAVCGHRPVLPDMLAGLGLEDRALQVAEVLAVHLDAEANPVAVEDWTPLD